MILEFQFDHRELLFAAAAEAFADTVRGAVERHGVCNAAFSGGKTPDDLFRLLAKDCRIDWRKVRFFQVDERCVPRTSPASNFRRLSELLLEPLKVPHSHVFPIPTDWTEAAELYERVLPEAFDLVLLGMGQDGHIASLFPGAEALKETRRRVLHVPAPAGAEPKVERITLTLPVLRAARETLLLFFGAEKIHTFHERRDRQLPVGELDHFRAYFAR